MLPINRKDCIESNQMLDELIVKKMSTFNIVRLRFLNLTVLKYIYLCIIYEYRKLNKLI